MNRKKGFTLIELLVVIAIIGILSSIVLVALRGARNKAKDARIKADVSQVRSLAEVDYDGDYSGITTTSSGSCPGDGSDYDTLCQDITDQGGDLVIQTCDSDAKYSAHSSLNASDGVYCVDSSGQAGIGSSPPGTDCACNL